MHDKIQKLRDDGKFLIAINELQCQLKTNAANSELSPKQRSAPWRKHLLGDKCLLLEAARNNKEAPSEIENIENLIESTELKQLVTQTERK